MEENLKCFISASSEVDIVQIKNILKAKDVETIDIYDFSIGNSIQQILKRKIREADFALFILTQDNHNTIYELGVCEGLGKQHFIFLDKDVKIPFYLENKLFIRTNLRDRDLLSISIENILNSVNRKRTKRKNISKNKNVKSFGYNKDTRANLRSYLSQINRMRESGFARELEYVVEEIFKAINLNYVENTTNKDKGVDFALWSDELGKIVGNPIIVEVKYGNLNQHILRNAEEQLARYIQKSDAKVAFLLYLDKNGNRYKIKSSLNPFIISYDMEDFVNDLLHSSFDHIVLTQRNKIAHGME